MEAYRIIRGIKAMKKAKVNAKLKYLCSVCMKSKELKRSMFCNECRDKALKTDIRFWN